MARHISIYILLTVSLFSCNSLYYQTDFLGDQNPHEFRSYFTEVQCDQDVYPIVADNIQDAIERNVHQIGYTPDANGDLLIKYLIKNTSKKFTEECVKEYGRFGGGEICRERVVTYKEGSLILDIIDASTNEIIWYGAAYGPSFNDWKDNREKIDEMVNTLFSRYYSLLK